MKTVLTALSSGATENVPPERREQTRRRALSIQDAGVHGSGRPRTEVREPQAESWSVGPKTKQHRMKEEGRGFQGNVFRNTNQAMTRHAGA